MAGIFHRAVVVAGVPNLSLKNQSLKVRVRAGWVAECCV